MTPEIFISHSTADKAVAERVCEVLERHGLACWIAPRDVALGASWPASILHAIEQTKAFVLVLSSSSNLSPYVVSEVNLAFSHRKSIFVLRTEDIPPTEDLQFFLACPQWTDAFPPPLENHLARMAGALRLLLGKDQLKPTAASAPAPSPSAAETRLAGRTRPPVEPPPPPVLPTPEVRPPPQRAVSEGSWRPPVAPPLPSPTEPVPPRPRVTVFDSDGHLQSQAFDFAVDGILLRAARRRNEQERAQASVADLMAGLLRAGGLTRQVLQHLGRDPDDLYAKLREVREATTASAPPLVEAAVNDGTMPDAAELQAMLARWILHRREDFAPAVISLFEAAAAASGAAITERTLLELVAGSPAWDTAGVELPTVDEMRRAITACTQARMVDSNGAIPLEDLEPAAREIIQRAHLLSQQCESETITHRLLLASFIADPTRFAARVCRRAGVDTELLQALLVTMGSVVEKTPGTVGSSVLSPAVGARIVAPVLAEARRHARDPRRISEAELFRAFCRVADPSFAEFLRARSTDPGLETMEADLAELANLDPADSDRLDGLTLRAREVIRLAHQLARDRGQRVIPNRFLFAALLWNKDAAARRLLRTSDSDAQILCDRMVASAEPGPAAEFALDDEACRRIVTPVLVRARELASKDCFVTETQLFQAFCERADPEFLAALRSIGVNLTPTRRGAVDVVNPRLWGPN